MADIIGSPQGTGTARRSTSMRISRVKPWVAIALLAGVVITGIYGFQGYRYFDAWERTASMTAQTNALMALLSRDEPPLGNSAIRLDAGQQKLGDLKRSFEYDSIDGLIATLSNTAARADVGLSSINVSDPAPKIVEGIRYNIQPITVTALGTPQGIFRFLETIGEPAPSAVVSSIQLSGLDSTSMAKLTFHFYLSPEPVADDEQEGIAVN